MKKNMNRAINEKYFNDPVQNAAFICCIDVLAELVEKYGDKVLDTISDGVNSSNVCDYIFIANGMSVLCEAECQTAHCGRCKPRFVLGEFTSPIVPYRNLPQTPGGMTADCRSLV